MATPPKGTLVWSSSPTAGQPMQPTQSPPPPSGSLQWTSSPTYTPDDIFDVPEVTTPFADRARTALGYDTNIKRQQDIAERYVAGKSSTPEMLAQSAMNTAGAVAAPVIKGIGKVLQGADYLLSGKGTYNPIPEKNLYTDIKGGAKETGSKWESAISDMPSVQKYAQSDASQSFEEYLRGANDLLVFTPLPKIVAGSNKVLSAAEEYAIQQANKLKESRADSSLQTVMNQIRQTEKVGAGAKTAETAKDALVLQKMAQSNVLPRTVDKTGTVDATAIKEAQRQYLEQPIGQQEDGTPITVRNAESVVSRLLKQEGATVNINQVVNSLRTAVEQSGLAADIMQRALDVGVPKFAQALMKYADEFGNVALENLHTEKIRTTANLDYGKPASAIYRKSLASGLRKIIEDTSKHPIASINQELALHLEAVKRIGKLAGKKVEGGRLGTHVARGVGTGLGIVLGSVAGPVGSAVAGALGGGIGQAVQSAKMQRTFGKPGESIMPGSKLLESASAQAEKPPVRDLTVPDKPKGARPGVPKTKEILRLERAIRENVQAQKEAIKAKDFVLVEKLKEIYDHLVQKLKEAINKVKNTPNKQGGFIGGSDNQKPTYSQTNRSPQKVESPSADTTTHLQKAQQALREAKGLSASDIMAKYPDINLKRDVAVTDIHGKKSVIPEGEALTPYELKGNKVLLQDGETYIVSKNQWQNVKGNAVSGEAKEFAPELKGTEETVKGTQKMEVRDKAYADFDAGKITREERNAIIDKLGVPNETKYSSYTLPDGKNYKEVLIKAPLENGRALPDGSKIKEISKDNWGVFDKDGKILVRGNSQAGAKSNWEIYGDINDEVHQGGNWRKNERKDVFKSSHWDEPNVLAHLRLNERTYKGKKVTFMEELQSDWAREARSKNPKYIVEKADNLPGNKYWATKVGDEVDNGTLFDTKAEAEAWVTKNNVIPDNPLLKNWQELSVKRALQEAVANKSEYFAWINGEQTSARYNLATHVKDVKWQPFEGGTDSIKGQKIIFLEPKDGITIKIRMSQEGEILSSDNGWKGKKLDEVLGKGLADKIMEKEKGTLSGEGLKFGGEWANTLYDKQVKNIVEDVTGGRVEIIKLNTGNERQKAQLAKGIGDKESVLTEQQAIRLTPEIKARILGKAPTLKKPSGINPFK